MECLHDNAILVGTVSDLADLFLTAIATGMQPLIRPSTQPSHPILAKNGLCTRQHLPPRAKTNTFRTGNVQCCDNYNRPQRLWLPAKLFRKLIKSCFTRCVRAADRLPAAAPHTSHSLRRSASLGPRRAKSAAACLPAARR
jgi:hypothetical protein